MSNDARPDPIVVDDVVLIKEALSGDGEAFAVLVDRHKNTIFNLCYRMMGNYQDAQDISQEAFLQVWRKLSWFRAGQKFRNWLITIAINLCRNKLKRDKIIRFISIDRTVRTEDGEIPVEVADATPTPEQLALGKEWKKRINLMVSSL
ncbi:MAG: sigma-70 family RNA polymerase sigma factor, partial [Elusimicrobia bacterium]|nr:sigma-70 family RNA polymerase sigma factor [Elusimicrobiota bacterium]